MTRLRRPTGSLNAELLGVLGVQSLPAAELHRLTTNDAVDGSYAEKVIQNIETNVPPVGAKRVMTDETRTIELHLLEDSPHDKGLIVVYLPKEKMLIEVDAYTPLAGDDPPPTVPPPAAVNLYENIERLKLDVDRIVPLHGRIVRLEDLKKTIGK